MSHIVAMSLKIQSIASLSDACQMIGLELVKGQLTYKWWGRSVGDYPIPQGMKASELGKCLHAIRIPDNKNAYEIGVVQNKQDGGFSLVYDFYGAAGQAMQSKVGQTGGLLKQAYSIARAKKEAQKKGMRTLLKKKQNGNMLLEVY